jgi:cytochrome c5
MTQTKDFNMKIFCKFAVLSMLLLMFGCASNQQTPKTTSSDNAQDPQLEKHTLPAIAKDPRFENGKRVYQGTCIACHGADGTGALPGVPNLTRLDGFNKNSHSDFALFKHVEHVEKGLKRPGDPMAMPPNGGNPNLTDEDIHDALIYMRAEFLSES